MNRWRRQRIPLLWPCSGLTLVLTTWASAIRLRCQSIVHPSSSQPARLEIRANNPSTGRKSIIEPFLTEVERWKTFSARSLPVKAQSISANPLGRLIASCVERWCGVVKCIGALFFPGPTSQQRVAHWMRDSQLKSALQAIPSAEAVFIESIAIWPRLDFMGGYGTLLVLGFEIASV